MPSLVAYAYDELGRRASKTFFNGQRTEYTYDPASRLTKLNFPRWPHSIDLAYDDASRISSKTASYDGFVWNHHAAFDRVFADADHQNKLTTSTTVGAGGTTYGYSQLVGSDLIMDGNLTGDGTSAWGYDNQNRLVSASGGVTLSYDGRDRLHSVAQGGATTRFQYDGDDLIGEYNAAGALQRRYVHGPGEDEPLIWYDSADLLYKRTLLADERGSIIEVAKATPLGSPETLEFNDYDGLCTSARNDRSTWTAEAARRRSRRRVFEGRLCAAAPSALDWRSDEGSFHGQAERQR